MCLLHNNINTETYLKIATNMHQHVQINSLGVPTDSRRMRGEAYWLQLDNLHPTQSWTGSDSLHNIVQWGHNVLLPYMWQWLCGLLQHYQVNSRPNNWNIEWFHSINYLFPCQFSCEAESMVYNLRDLSYKWIQIEFHVVFHLNWDCILGWCQYANMYWNTRSLVLPLFKYFRWS